MDQDLPLQKEYIKTLGPEFNGLIFIPSVKDKDAFNRLFKKLYLPVYHFACRFVNTADAEDITADSFLKLWRSDLDYSIIPKVKTWLHVCTRNACIDFIKHQKNKSAQQLDFAKFQLEDTGSSDQGNLIKEELLSRLHLEIEKLPAQCKRVFNMAYLEGLTSKEIAAILHISENTVSKHRYKGFRLVRFALKSHTYLLLAGIIILSCIFVNIG